MLMNLIYSFRIFFVQHSNENKKCSYFEDNDECHHYELIENPLYFANAISFVRRHFRVRATLITTSYSSLEIQKIAT